MNTFGDVTLPTGKARAHDKARLESPPRGSPLGLDMLLPWASVSVGKTSDSKGSSQHRAQCALDT